MVRRALLLTVGLLTTVYYVKFGLIRLSAGPAEFYMPLQAGVLDGTVGSPFTHRLLVPYLLSPFISDYRSLTLAYGAADVIFYLLFLVLLDRWLCLWIAKEAALLGVILTALCLPLMFIWSAMATSSPIEACLFIGGLLCLKQLYTWDMPRSSS